MKCPVPDRYAYTEVDMALPHMYHGYGDDGKNAIFTAPERNDKIKEKDQQEHIKQLDNERQDQEKNIIQLYKQQQQDKLQEYQNYKK